MFWRAEGKETKTERPHMGLFHCQCSSTELRFLLLPADNQGVGWFYCVVSHFIQIYLTVNKLIKMWKLPHALAKARQPFKVVLLLLLFSSMLQKSGFLDYDK